jgi:hypothetical protein
MKLCIILTCSWCVANFGFEKRPTRLQHRRFWMVWRQQREANIKRNQDLMIRLGLEDAREQLGPQPKSMCV